MAKRRKAAAGKTLMEVFAAERVALPVDGAAVLVRELDRAMDQCPLCQKWNSRTVGHLPGCRLGEYLGRRAS